MASSRLAYAIFCAGAIIWVYGLSTLIFYSLKNCQPQKGKAVVVLFLTSVVLSIYVLLIGLINPLLIAATWFMVLFVCPCCAGSGLFEEKDTDTADMLAQVLMEAMVLSGLIIVISLIREPIGLGTLSFPGGASGIFELFGSGEGAEGFFPVYFLSIAAGGFLLLGAITAVFRNYRGQNYGSEGDL
jgi:hypothetical protein